MAEKLCASLPNWYKWGQYPPSALGPWQKGFYALDCESSLCGFKSRRSPLMNNIRRECRISNLDLFAGYVAYIKDAEEKIKTLEENEVEEVNAVFFPDYMGQYVNELA